jgi:hypothetical protein
VPYLGSGVDQHVNTSPVPTWVFSPSPAGGASVRLYNEGTQPVYIGGANVSPYNGLPLYPGSRPLEIQNANGTIYTCSAVSPGTAAGTMSAAALPAGATLATLTTAVPTAFAAGSTFTISNGSTNAEVLVVASTTASSVVNFTTAALYDHVASSLFTAVTTKPGQLRVTAGVV